MSNYRSMDYVKPLRSWFAHNQTYKFLSLVYTLKPKQL